MKAAFAYIASRPEIEDVVISGGDAYMLAPGRLRMIGEILLEIPHIRRIRFASKGPAVMPMKILSDTAWTEALIEVVDSWKRKREGGSTAHTLQQRQRDHRYTHEKLCCTLFKRVSLFEIKVF